MNTVGKTGRLGEQVRCVVSVSMLTEGWDTNTVTHILGVRAFGTQLLCEQVVGRALRRQSYDLNEEGLFDVEYADILGIPFDFTAKPVVVKPSRPSETVRVHAVKERAALEIIFPRVEGYRVELPNERITAQFTDELAARAHARAGRAVRGPAGRHRRRGRRRWTSKHLDEVRPSSISYPSRQASAVHAIPRSRRGAEAAPVRPAQAASRGAGSTRAIWSARAAPSRPSSSIRRSPTRRPSASTSPASAASQGEQSDQGDPRPLQPARLHRPRQLHHQQSPLADHRPQQLPRQLRGLRQRLGGRVRPRRRGASARARLRQEPGSRPRGALSRRRDPAEVPARLHRSGSTTAGPSR